MAAAVAASGSLARLRLDYNKIGNEGAKALAVGVAASGSMSYLNLVYNSIGAAAKQSLHDHVHDVIQQGRQYEVDVCV